MTIDLNRIIRIFVCLGLILFFSCSNKSLQYSYAYYYGKDSIPSSYQIRKLQYEKDYRTDRTFSSEDIAGPFQQVGKEKYVLTKDGLDKVIRKGDSIIRKPYLTILNGECIGFSYDNGMDDVMATSLCFLGIEDIVIGDREYNDAYKFKKEQGEIDGVESLVYYDSCFILLKEEYVSGYAEDYRIVRLDESIKIRN